MVFLVKCRIKFNELGIFTAEIKVPWLGLSRLHGFSGTGYNHKCCVYTRSSHTIQLYNHAIGG